MKFFNLKKIIILSVLFFVFSGTALAVSGIPKESVWMSKKSPEEGETVSLFTFVFNGQESSNLYGDIEWYDEDTLIGERSFTILPLSGQAISIEWKVTDGNHEIKPIIVNTKSGKDKESATTILIEDSEASPLVFFVANKIEETEGPLSEEKIFGDLDNLENKIVSSTPPVVAETIGKSFGFLEETRNELKNNISEEIVQVEEKTKELNNETDTTTEVDTPNEGDSLDTVKDEKKESPAVKYVEKPALGIYGFSLNSLYFILSSALLTYGLLIFFFYLISRFVYRKIRKK